MVVLLVVIVVVQEGGSLWIQLRISNGLRSAISVGIKVHVRSHKVQDGMVSYSLSCWLLQSFSSPPSFPVDGYILLCYTDQLCVDEHASSSSSASVSAHGELSLSTFSPISLSMAMCSRIIHF